MAPTAIEPELTSMLAAFETSARVELAIRRHPDAAIGRLVEDIHLQRAQLAQDLRSYLYRTSGPDAGARPRAGTGTDGSSGPAVRAAPREPRGLHL